MTVSHPESLWCGSNYFYSASSPLLIFEQRIRTAYNEPSPSSLTSWFSITVVSIGPCSGLRGCCYTDNVARFQSKPLLGNINQKSLGLVINRWNRQMKRFCFFRLSLSAPRAILRVNALTAEGKSYGAITSVVNMISKFE